MSKTKRATKFLGLFLAWAFLFLFQDKAYKGVILLLITGNPNAKQHIIYALVGSAIGFGAQSIIDFISLTVY